MSTYVLEILADNEEIRNFYNSRQNHTTDSGVDLYVPTNVSIECGTVSFVNHGIKCRMIRYENNIGFACAYFLYPRSSISKTPLMLANSVGIIDSEYRGHIIAALRHISTNESYDIEKGTRLVQICAPNLSPIQVRLVDELDETKRSDGGFGSTGK